MLLEACQSKSKAFVSTFLERICDILLPDLMNDYKQRFYTITDVKKVARNDVIVDK